MTRFIATMFHQGGSTMFLIEYLAVPGLVIVALHVFRPERWSRWLGVSIIALVLATGIYGTLDGRQRTDAAVEAELADRARPDRGSEDAGERYRFDPEEERTMGYAEAMRPIQFAGVAACALALGLGLGELRRRRASRR